MWGTYGHIVVIGFFFMITFAKEQDLDILLLFANI